MHNFNSRRIVLRNLAFTLPAAWSAPVIQAVSLPAHAQTSCAETDTILGRTFACDSSEICIQVSFSLNDGCLTRMGGQKVCEGDEFPPAANEILVAFGFLTSIPGRMRINIYGPDGQRAGVVQDCPPEEALEDFESTEGTPFTIMVDGVEYSVDFAYGRTQSPPTIYFTDMLVTPT